MMKRWELEDLHPDLPTAAELAEDEAIDADERNIRLARERKGLQPPLAFDPIWEADGKWDNDYPPPPF